MLQSASSIALPYQAINLLLFEEQEISTYSGKIIHYESFTQGLVNLTQQADRVVVEGTDGGRSLMNDARPLSCWVIEQQLPVVLVVGIQLGCISHALLTDESIHQDGLPLVGWVAHRINPGLAQYSDIIEMLREKISAPLLGELPYLPRAEQRDLTSYIDISLLDEQGLHPVSAKIA